MSHEAYNDMIDRMVLTVELMEADRDLNVASSIPADKVFSDLREMKVEKECGSTLYGAIKRIAYK